MTHPEIRLYPECPADCCEQAGTFLDEPAILYMRRSNGIAIGYRRPLTLDEAKEAAREKYGQLNCNTVNAVPVDVDWGDAFCAYGTCDGEADEPRAAIVYPSYTVEDDGSELLDYIDEHDSDKADEFRERLRGLSEDDAKELADLDAVVLADGWTEGQRERVRELREERDSTREDLDDIREEIEEAANECAQEEPSDFEPMMNYAYPLPGFDWEPGAAQAALDSLPLVVVKLDGEHVLALSGGGMDLSWEICTAYIRLGYRPPVHFAELPQMAGRGVLDHDRMVMALCVESGEVAARWAQNVVERMGKRFQ